MKSRSIAPMRVAKVGYIVLSVAMGSLGAVFIVRPETSAVALGRLCGGLMILLGVIKLVGFFSKDLYRLAFQYDCIFGALLIALGATVLLRPGGLLTVLCVALGLYILADGLFRMRMAWEARAFGIRLWWLIMTAAAVSGAHVPPRRGRAGADDPVRRDAGKREHSEYLHHAHRRQDHPASDAGRH